VVLNAHLDLWQREFPGALKPPSSSLLPAPQRAQPDPAPVAGILGQVAACQRPVIVAGRGAVASDAQAAPLSRWPTASVSSAPPRF
jgi:thiamine pyrophosphate-dependent acetolactate synthase large subunit-like protein